MPAAVPLADIGVSLRPPHRVNKTAKVRKIDETTHLVAVLATWHLIPSVYTPDNVSYLRRVRPTAEEPELIQRFIDVLVEHKIALSDQRRLMLRIPLREPIETPVTANDLDNAVHGDAIRIVHAIELCLQAAGVEGSDIQSVFLTGGSTAIAEVRRQILKLVPQARPVTGDLFGNVGLGLAIEAERRFGAGSA